MANDAEKSLQVYARLAGFMYLFVIAVDVAGLAITSRFVVPGNLAETARNITAAERLYRIGLSGVLIGSWTTILLGWAFYALLERVDRNLALFALLSRVGEAVVGGVSVMISLTRLSIYTGAARELGVTEQEVLVTLLRRANSAGFTVSLIFFSLGSIVFFYLLHKSRFIPRMLAGFGIFASVLVTMLGFATLIFPERSAALENPVWVPIFIAEVATGLWLLIRGADLTYWNERRKNASAL